MTKSKKPEGTVLYSFRLAPSLVARLDAHAVRLSAPGIKINRTDALRSLLVAGLDAAEATTKGARR